LLNLIYICVNKVYILVNSMSDCRFVCVHCGKGFKYRCHLIRHENRKTPCAPILEQEDLSEDVMDDPDLKEIIENEMSSFIPAPEMMGGGMGPQQVAA